MEILTHAAWCSVTHPLDDHMNLLAQRYADYARCETRRIAVNFAKLPEVLSR